MKRNWSIIIALIALLIAYDLFILRPYNQKLAAQKQTEKAVEQKSDTTNNLSAIQNETTKAEASSDNVSMNVVTNEINELKEVETLSLGSKRQVRLMSNGTLVNATFNDYFQRGTAEKIPVEILKDGLSWSSTNPAVQKCLSSLNYKGNLTFSGRFEGITCSLQYQQASEQEGVYSSSLSLSGIKSFEGTVFWQQVARLGEGNRFDFKILDFKLDGETDDLQGDKVFETKVFKGKLDWSSWGDKYFTTIVLPKGKFNPDLAVTPIDGEAVAEGQRRFRIAYQYPLVDLGEQTMVFESDLYIGTKDISVLKSIRKDLVDAVEMGWFSAVGRFMLWCLEELNLLFKNFGWSIIALTVLVRLVFWPLNRKVFESGQKMKDIQPKIEALRKKYGKDRAQMEQLNREMMGLYKTEKVNPMGSCMPLLLQMPIFIGLYGSLSNAIDLYQAPFVWWIEDLSYKDPFYVLPILWTASLLLMMKFTPQPTMNQPGMPDMKKVMFVMYFVFGFMAKDWPSGLCLYLVVSSFLGTFQQFLFRRSQTNLQTVQEGA